MQWHAAWLIVFGSPSLVRIDRKGYVAAIEVDVAPIQPQGLPDPRAGVEQKDHQGAQMPPASGNQTFGSFGSERSQPSRRFFWPLHHDMRAPAALSRVLYDR